jgi:uncharacterized protein (TIGR03083 family)
VDVRHLARDERADFAAFLATLSPQQWQAPTLCARWRVRDVVAHVISYDELDARGLLAHVVRGRFRPDQVNAAALARYDTRTPEQLPALLTGPPAALRAAGGAGRQGRTRLGADPSPGHLAPARTGTGQHD